MFAVEKYKFYDVILLFFKYKQIKDILRYSKTRTRIQLI